MFDLLLYLPHANLKFPPYSLCGLDLKEVDGFKVFDLHMVDAINVEAQNLFMK